MYRLHYWPTPNGHKITLFLEEAGLPYQLVPVNIMAGDQFKPEFLKLSPNNRMPALEDLEDGVQLFESGAILLYLADKTGRFMAPPAHASARAEVLQWLFWQMGGLGPMLGQANHFCKYAPERIPYAITRYRNEGQRLLHVLNGRLADRRHVAGDAYSIADMACYPWVKSGMALLGDGQELPHLARWLATVAARPATARAYTLAGRPEFRTGEATEEQKRRLFQQGANSVRR